MRFDCFNPCIHSIPRLRNATHLSTHRYGLFLHEHEKSLEGPGIADWNLMSVRELVDNRITGLELVGVGTVAGVEGDDPVFHDLLYT